MKQTIEIEIPDGKKAVWKDGTVVFEDIKPKLPKTWEEYCSNNKIRKDEFYIDSFSNIIELTRVGCNRNSPGDKNLLPSQKAAEAHLALMQLHQLRDCYRQGWIPDWGEWHTLKYCIYSYTSLADKKKKWSVTVNNGINAFLSFQEEAIAREFLNNFKDLIVQAGDLI